MGCNVLLYDTKGWCNYGLQLYFILNMFFLISLIRGNSRTFRCSAMVLTGSATYFFGFSTSSIFIFRGNSRIFRFSAVVQTTLGKDSSNPPFRIKRNPSLRLREKQQYKRANNCAALLAKTV